MNDIAELLELAKQASIIAGKVIMDVYASGNFEIDHKSDLSPLTLADRAAHTIIEHHLAPSGLPILSEEGDTINFDERKAWKRFWIVDPLDGTKEFIKKTGEFTVNIALLDNEKPVAGIIYAPCPDILYYGSVETGVYKIEKGKQLHLESLHKKITLEELLQKEKITVVASKSHMNDETTAFIKQFKNAKLTSMGSSFKLMLVAEGAADIYPRLASTMEWDTAAGHALLRSLNRGVYQTDLQTELVYNKEVLLNPSFIAF